jgi:hypothetical protein
MTLRGRAQAYKPRGWPRSVLAPGGSVAGKVALERDAARRWERLRNAAVDALRERTRRPRRRRMRALELSPGARLRWREAPAPPPRRDGRAAGPARRRAVSDLLRRLPRLSEGAPRQLPRRAADIDVRVRRRRQEVTPSTFRGKPCGATLAARGRLLEGAEEDAARQALARRHPVLQRWVVPWLHRLLGYTTVHYEITAR